MIVLIWHEGDLLLESDDWHGPLPPIGEVVWSDVNGWYKIEAIEWELYKNRCRVQIYCEEVWEE